MKLLIDMNLSPLWATFLADRGFDVVHWCEIGVASAPDAEIMKYAESNGFVIFTHDLDFGAILAARKAGGPSVIQIRAQDVLPVAMGEIVIRALSAAHGYLESGALVTIDPKRHRIRLLPL